MTGSRRDESVSVSLRTLMDLEEERVRSEREAEEARDARARREAQEAREREREALRAAEAAEAEARRAEEQRERAEQARLAAMHQATVEQARIAEEARARAFESERERSHQLALERVRAEALRERSGSRTFVSGAFGLLLGVAASSALWLLVVRPDDARSRAALEARLTVTEQRGVALERDLAAAQKESETLRASLRAAEAARPSSPPPAPSAPLRGPKGHAPPRDVRAPASRGTCQKGDPICDDGRILR